MNNSRTPGYSQFHLELFWLATAMTTSWMERWWEGFAMQILGK